MKISDLFNVKYGINLELNTLEIVSSDASDGVNFVARTATNNGVVAKVRKIEDLPPQAAGILTCAGGGSVLSTFVQVEPFYSGRDLYLLIPRHEMTLAEKLYYCMCINANAYRYSYGRQANRTLESIELPTEIPSWVYNARINPISTSVHYSSSVDLQVNTWKDFTLLELFDFKKGKRLTKEDMILGNINFIGAISTNNGIRETIDTDTYNEPNCITINYNGSVGEAFYQIDPFWASDDVNVLYPKGWSLNKYIAMFIVTIIKAERYRFSYGRKWTLDKMKSSIIKLPVTSLGTPDWEYMENYIRLLPYSDKLI